MFKRYSRGVAPNAARNSREKWAPPADDRGHLLALGLERGGTLDSMRVVVERSSSPDVAAGAGVHLQRLVKNSIGVDVVEPGSIERSVGKMRRIVDLRPPR